VVSVSDTKFLIIFLHRLEHVTLHVNVVLDAGSLQVFHAGRGTSHDEHGTAVKILESGDGVLCVLIVRRADDDYVGLGFEGGIYAFLYGLEAEVVNDLPACRGQEVARELGTGLTHCRWSA